MASRKKKKRSRALQKLQTKKKRNPERELAKALNDLTKLFPRKKLARQFKLKERQVTLYKNYRKRNPLPAKKRTKILRFYRKLQAAKHYEDLKFSYRVTGRDHRLLPIKGITATEVNDLVKKHGIKKTAKILGKSQDTVMRWKSGQFRRIKPKDREKIYKANKKVLGKAYDGIFYRALKGKSKDGYFYVYAIIQFFRSSYQSREDMEGYVKDKHFYPVDKNESVIERRHKFSEGVATRFIGHLANIKKHGNSDDFQKSLYAVNEFIDTEFKGKKYDDIRNRLRSALTKPKKKSSGKKGKKNAKPKNKKFKKKSRKKTKK